MMILVYITSLLLSLLDVDTQRSGESSQVTVHLLMDDLIHIHLYPPHLIIQFLQFSSQLVLNSYISHVPFYFNLLALFSVSFLGALSV